MPFIFVWGIPEATPKYTLVQLRRKLVSALAENMGVDTSWVRVFFPSDRTGDPIEGENDHIYVTIETGMFYKKAEDDSTPKYATSVIAQLIWDVFEGQFEVECFIGNHNPAWVTLIEAKKLG
ncbi:MAG: hypothetical protein LCI00_00380 [Chloroflexi bacterium]|nr:hypothetical protein [Chloroflexota bacterium]